MSKRISIRNENDLRQEFASLVPELDRAIGGAGVNLRLQLAAAGPEGGFCQPLELVLDGNSIIYDVHYTVRATKALVSGHENDASNAKTASRLLVTPLLNKPWLDYCREHGVSAIDLNGRVYLRAPGLLVDQGPLPGRDFRVESEPQNVFVGKSARIVRSLLAHPSRVWRQRDLVERAKVSAGLASRIVNHLLSREVITKINKREFRLVDWHQLLELWKEEDDFARRTTTYRYSVLGSDLVELSNKLVLLLKEQSVPVALTQWIAGWLRYPYTEPPLVSAYVPRHPGDALLKQIGLRPVPDGGRIWLHVPDDDGVFLETQEIRGLPLVTDAQIYLDLVRTGLRGPDQAKALREWEGFCRE